MRHAAPRCPLPLRAALITALATAPLLGCARGTASATTPGAVHAPLADDGEALPHEAELTWFVRPLPTNGTVHVTLFLDAGSRDATPPQVATLAAFALAERLSRGDGGPRVDPRVTPDATSFELTCPATELSACVRRFEAVLRPDALAPSELVAAHRRLRGDRARAVADETRAAQAAALRALFGAEAPQLFPLGEEQQDAG